MPTKLITCTIDSYVNQDHTATNYGKATKLVANGTSSHKKYIYLFFPKPFPAAKSGSATVTVTAATLTFYLDGAWAGSNVVTVKRVTHTWAESKVTWASPVSGGPTVVTTNDTSVTVTSGSDQQAVAVDLTAMLGNVAGGSAWYGVRIECATSGDRSIYSGEVTNGLQPTLSVSWAQLPDAPSDLKPTDGSVLDTAVSVIGQWTFQDQDGTATQADSQIQVDDSSALGSPLWDSGTQPNTITSDALGYDIQILTVTGGPAGGSTTLRYGGTIATQQATTGAIAYNAQAADIEAALNALITIASGVPAAYATNLTGTNNDLDITAVTRGTVGNSITITYVDPGGTTATLSVTVSGNAITVHLGRAASAINTTATLLAAAIASTPAAAALVVATNHSTDTGAGLVTAMAVQSLTGGENAGGSVTVSDLTASAGLPADKMAIKFSNGGVRSTLVATDSYTGGAAPATVIGHSGIVYSTTNGLLGIDLPNNSTRYWRVKVTDTFGGTSPWSAIQSFTLNTKGTVTIGYPTTTLQETGPEIQWTFTDSAGAAIVQTGYQVIITQTATGFVTWDSGRVATTDTFTTVPTGLINVTDAGFYTIEVRAWDSQARFPNNGDPAYATTTLSGVTYTPGSGDTAIGSLTAVSSYAAVVLTFTRSSPPDYFALKVDGKVPSGTDANGDTWDRLVPGNYLVSGTTYAINWYRARPQISATYEVNAVVNHSGILKVTTGDPTATLIADPPGLWFIHTHSGLGVVLTTVNQRAAYEWDLGEEAVEYFPLGRQDPVRVTTSMRGYEGTVQGELKDFAGITPEQARQRLEDFKSELGLHPIRLIVQGLNIPVRIGQVKLSPIHPVGYSVSISFSQTDEFAVSPPSL